MTPDERKERARLRAAAWRAANPDKVREINRKRKDYKNAWAKEHYDKDKSVQQVMKYRAKNRDRWLEYMKRWRESNRERISEYARQKTRRWNAENPEKRAIHHANRRALKRGAVGSISAKDISELFYRQRGRCAACGTSLNAGFHKDHVMPLILCGLHDISNIQLLCPSCNLSKKDMHPDAWAQRIGKLFV